MALESPLLLIIFLLSSSILAGLSTAIQRMGKMHSQEIFKKTAALSFLQRTLTFWFGSKRWDGLFFTLSFSKHILQLCYAMAAFFFLIVQDSFKDVIKPQGTLVVIPFAATIIGLSLFSDFLLNLLAAFKPKIYFKTFAPIASLLILVCCPVTALFFKLLKNFFPLAQQDKNFPVSFRIRDKILEVLHESELSPHLDPNDRKLILSVASFKERIAREVMVPRIDVFSLPAETSVREAAQSFTSERYSRIPVYRDSVDHIIGVLLYKDVLNIYIKGAQFDMPIESLVKPVLYTPETKRISHLLQEFRNKQIHLAIVVDEYGGTEGIVTIEDILEELVGEIADEYDVGEEVMFSVLPTGGWIVDAKMNILDIEEELGIKIPQSPEYDTIGGFIYHRAGAIPTKGWRIHHDDFDLEIISSSERSIEKIRITPHKENSSDLQKNPL